MSNFRVLVTPATPEERAQIEAVEPIASDVCIAVHVNGRFVGWGDDYETFHPIHWQFNNAGPTKAGEDLLIAASSLLVEVMG